jgi:hypothetical protein
MYRGQKVRIGPMERVPGYPRSNSLDPTSYVGMEAEVREVLPSGEAILSVPEKVTQGKSSLECAPLSQLILIEDSPKASWE